MQENGYTAKKIQKGDFQWPFGGGEVYVGGLGVGEGGKPGLKSISK